MRVRTHNPHRFLNRRVLEAMRENPRPATCREITKRASWSNVNSVRSSLTELVNAGLVSPAGTYPQTYVISEAAE